MEKYITYDNKTGNGVLSVLIQTIGSDGNISNQRESLTPGHFERAKEILTDSLYTEIEKLWTPEIIATWKQKQSEQEELLENT